MKYLFLILFISFNAFSQKDLVNKDISCSDYNSLESMVKNLGEDLKKYDQEQQTHLPAVAQISETKMRMESNLIDVKASLEDKVFAVKKIKPSFKLTTDEVLKLCEDEKNNETTLTNLLFIAASESESIALRQCLDELNELKMKHGGQVTTGDFSELRNLIQVMPADNTYVAPPAVMPK